MIKRYFGINVMAELQTVNLNDCDGKRDKLFNFGLEPFSW